MLIGYGVLTSVLSSIYNWSFKGNCIAAVAPYLMGINILTTPKITHNSMFVRQFVRLVGKLKENQINEACGVDREHSGQSLVK